MIKKAKQRFGIFFIILGSMGLSFMGFSTTAQELTANVQQESIIVDVRTAKEFAEDSNPASINIPLDELESKLDTLDKDKTIIVCCRSGRRSALAASILLNHGFKNVIDAGAWKNTLSTSKARYNY